MSEKKEIHVFICEDDLIAAGIVRKYFNKGQITFAAVYPEEQQRNRSTNRLITFQGKTFTSVEWGEITGIKAGEIRKRLYRGWPVQDALTFPCGKVGTLKRKYHG